MREPGADPLREGEPAYSCPVPIKALAVCFDDAHGT